MPKYRIEFSQTEYWVCEVEAASIDEAVAKFRRGEYGSSRFQAAAGAEIDDIWPLEESDEQS
jgi:hypothetical protein